MEQYSKPQQNDDLVFTTRGALMGFIAYIVLGLIIVSII